ncbi:MAG: M15 family metallopeptidase, partial [Bacilli bacterium]|nr:M15 family metallopeptidase [Bacilli bacterium]
VNDKQQVTPETKEAFQKMCDDAKKDNIYIYSGSAYRSYSYQNTLFNNRAKMEGLDYANKTAAKAGYSEHQTGLSMDLMNKNYDYISAEDEEYEWLINNSYKYGFILRFPKDMDNITGYTYEPWHFRYINVEIATYLKENNLTYEEYYGMNLNK